MRFLDEPDLIKVVLRSQNSLYSLCDSLVRKLSEGTEL